jgi:hypothetical protein
MTLSRAFGKRLAALYYPSVALTVEHSSAPPGAHLKHPRCAPRPKTRRPARIMAVRAAIARAAGQSLAGETPTLPCFPAMPTAAAPESASWHRLWSSLGSQSSQAAIKTRQSTLQDNPRERLASHHFGDPTRIAQLALPRGDWRSACGPGGRKAGEPARPLPAVRSGRRQRPPAVQTGNRGAGIHAAPQRRNRRCARFS